MAQPIVEDVSLPKTTGLHCAFRIRDGRLMAASSVIPACISIPTTAKCRIYSEPSLVGTPEEVESMLWLAFDPGHCLLFTVLERDKCLSKMVCADKYC